MIEYSKKSNFIKKGRGLINSTISNLPFELHLPGYQYCGPGTKLAKRLARGDPGINPLDQACKEHDISYSKHKNTADRNIADKILAEKAWNRVKSSNASFGERANALLVTNIMKAKAKFGMGVKKSSRRSPKKGATFRLAVMNARKAIQKQKPNSLKSATSLARKIIKKTFRYGKKNLKIPRVIPIPKTGGVLPFLVPLFAGLSAAGALTGGVSSIMKAVNAAKQANQQLKESQRHNTTMEAIAMGKGLYLKPYKKGMGLYLNPPPKNY